MVGLQQAGKGGGKLVCVEYLPVVEDAFHWGQGGADEEGNLIVYFLQFIVVQVELLVDFILKSLQTLIYGIAS